MAITASICAELACNSLAMVGIATLTMKASTPNMNCAATTIASTHQRRDESTCAETIWCMARRPYPTSVLPGSISGFGHPCDYLGGKLSRVLRPGITGGVRKLTKMRSYFLHPMSGRTSTHNRSNRDTMLAGSAVTLFHVVWGNAHQENAQVPGQGATTRGVRRCGL